MMGLIGRLHLIWILILLIAAFVVFANFIADVGGSADGIPVPTHRAVPQATVN